MLILRRGGIVGARKDGKMTKYRLTEQGRALLVAGTDTPD
jgi:hypothetical protein